MSELMKRIISAIIMAVGAALLLFTSSLTYLFLLLLIVSLASWEISNMTAISNRKKYIALGAGVLLTIGWFYFGTKLQYNFGGYHISLLSLLALITVIVFVLLKKTPNRDFVLFHILVWIAVMSVASWIDFPPLNLLSALFIAILTDIGAYFTGRLIGKRPLSKHSPNKTIEGAIGGIIFAVFGMLALGQWLLNYEFSVFLLILTVCVSIVGQVSDIVESAFKRRYGVKDSSQLIPGHGGILDRLDSTIGILVFLQIVSLIGFVF